MAPRLAGALEHGLKRRITIDQRPCAREVELDRQRIGRAAAPAPIGETLVSPKNPDFIAVPEDPEPRPSSPGS